MLSEYWSLKPYMQIAELLETIGYKPEFTQLQKKNVFSKGVDMEIELVSNLFDITEDRINVDNGFVGNKKIRYYIVYEKLKFSKQLLQFSKGDLVKMILLICELEDSYVYMTCSCKLVSISMISTAEELRQEREKERKETEELQKRIEAIIPLKYREYTTLKAGIIGILICGGLFYWAYTFFEKTSDSTSPNLGPAFSIVVMALSGIGFIVCLGLILLSDD